MIVHYIRRFFTSLSRRPPDAQDEQWVETLLPPAELLLFRRLANPDRRHLIHSARMVARALGPNADPLWIRVALLHDVGKFDSHLGVFGRVSATVLATALGTQRVSAWASTCGWKGRIGSYQRHGEIGAAEIRAAGGPPEAAIWSDVHHHRDRFSECGISPEMLAILDAADH